MSVAQVCPFRKMCCRRLQHCRCWRKYSLPFRIAFNVDCTSAHVCVNGCGMKKSGARSGRGQTSRGHSERRFRRQRKARDRVCGRPVHSLFMIHVARAARRASAARVYLESVKSRSGICEWQRCRSDEFMGYCDKFNYMCRTEY